MKKSIVLSVLCVFALLLIDCTRERKVGSPQQVKRLYQQALSDLKSITDTFLLFAENKSNIDTIRSLFKRARLQYKATELLTEYYYPATSKAINGAPVPEAEADNPGYPTEPSGFQVIEEIIYGEEIIKDYEGLILQAKLLQSAVVRLLSTSETLELTDAHIWDAVRLQCFRMMTLGISGYDSPLANLSLQEASASIKSMLLYLQPYIDVQNSDHPPALVKAMKTGNDYLNKNNDFIAFNRAEFITRFMRPILTSLNQMQDQLGIPYFTEPRPLSAKATSLFDSGAWNPWYYSANYAKPENHVALENLGKALFYEPLLSGNNIRTCASCHQPDKGFTDGLPKNKSFDGSRIIMRNTPSILFAALQPAQFADTRVMFLEDQAKQVIENPEEMHGDLTSAIKKIKRLQKYDSLFAKAFETKTISQLHLQTALAAYIRTKSVMNSRFDEYMQGNDQAITTKEIKGFNLFMGKAKCGTCHFMPLFNGTVPPNFTKMETEVLGVPENYRQPFKLDKDAGKYAVIPSLPYLNAFKTSTVRNAAITAPYMHNGAIQTLEELIDFYDKGGGAGLGIAVANQTLAPDQLHLSADEKSALIAFLKTLTNR